MWGSGMVPPQKEVWGVKLEIVGACHVAPPLEALDTCQKDRSRRNRLCYLRGIQILLFLQERRGWHVAPPQSGSTLPCGRGTGMEEAECATSEGGFSTFSDAGRSGHVSDKCQLSGEAFSNGATSEGDLNFKWGLALEEWRMDMWQFLRVAPTMPCGRREKQGTCGALIFKVEKAESRICATSALVWKILNGCFFWRKPRVTRVLYFFWRKLEMTCVIYFSEKK